MTRCQRLDGPPSRPASWLHPAPDTRHSKGHSKALCREGTLICRQACGQAEEGRAHPTVATSHPQPSTPGKTARVGLGGLMGSCSPVGGVGRNRRAGRSDSCPL